MRIKRRAPPPYFKVATCMKMLMTDPNASMEITNGKRCMSWHLLVQQRARKGFVRHYVRGI